VQHPTAQNPCADAPKRWRAQGAPALGIGELHVTLLSAFETQFKLKVFK
jgi:hypothetical protein